MTFWRRFCFARVLGRFGGDFTSQGCWDVLAAILLCKGAVAFGGDFALQGCGDVLTIILLRKGEGMFGW